MAIHPGRLISYWWPRGPLITADANTVAHLYWRGGALVDAKGNSWTPNGTIPYVGAVGPIPPGVGPTSNVNYYSLGTGNDVLDFAGDFSACVVYRAQSSSNAGIFANTDASVAGYSLQVNGGNQPIFQVRGGGGATTVLATGQTTSAGIQVISFGVSGTTAYLKANLKAIQSSAIATRAAGTANIATLGTMSAVASNPHVILEVWFSTTTPTDALFIAAQQQIFQRLRRAAP